MKAKPERHSLQMFYKIKKLDNLFGFAFLIHIYNWLTFFVDVVLAESSCVEDQTRKVALIYKWGNFLFR